MMQDHPEVIFKISHPSKIFRVFRSILQSDLWIFLLFSLIGIIFTWPLIIHFSDQVIGPFLGDNLEYIWKIWWVKHALLDIGCSPWFQPNIYAPYGYFLAYGEISPIHTFFGIPITVLFGPIVTYNLFILVSFILTGFFTYRFAREMGLSRSAATIAGVIFALCPYRIARIAGHLPLVDTQWLPLTLMFLNRFLTRPNYKNSVLIGLFFAASSLSSWYYGLMISFFLIIFVWIRFAAVKQVSWSKIISCGWPGIIVAGSLIFPFLSPYLQIQKLGIARIPLEQSIFWSGSITDYFVPNPLNFWFGKWVEQYLTLFRNGIPYEFILSLGFVPLSLSLLGLKKSRFEWRHGWAIWTITAVILSLGPVFKVIGVPFSLPSLGGISKTLNTMFNWIGLHSFARETYSAILSDRFILPLPALLLRWFLPSVINMRSWARFAMLASFGIAIMAGIGLEYVRQEFALYNNKPRFFTYLTTLFVFSFVLFEFYPGPRTLIRPGPRPVDLWLASQPKNSLVIQMPMSVALSGPQMFYTMYHQQPIASGYGTYFPILFKDLYSSLQEFPSDDSIDLLSRWGKDVDPSSNGVRYILVDERDVPPNDPLWMQIDRQPRLKWITSVKGIRIYTIQ